MSRPVVCSIGATDPWNAAGVGLDQRIVWECGARPVTVVAAVSAQSMHGLRSVVALDGATIAAQWDSLAGARIAAVRVGVLSGAPAVHAVAEILRRVTVPVVYDPVFGASAGGAFADEETLRAIREAIIRRTTVCTPNVGEAALLTGRSIAGVADMEAAGEALLSAGAGAVLVTGGHLLGDPVDVLVTRDGAAHFRATRIEREMRGTGCVLAAALSAYLARGDALRDAVEGARAIVRGKIAGSVSLGDGYVAE